MFHCPPSLDPWSWLIFDLIRMLDLQWLSSSPEDSIHFPEYIRFSTIVKSLVCVNDVAERNVQNVTSFANYAQSDRLETVVKVVSSDRELHSFQRLTKDELQNL